MSFDLPSWREIRHSGFFERERVRKFLSRQHLRQAISPLLVMLGLVLLGYVGTQYGEMCLEQRRLAQEWRRQQDARAVGPHSVATLTRLSVPKIDLDSVVVEGTNHKALLLGPGHMRNTPAPGELGNSVITGHRDTFFRHIHELEKGDTVLIERDGKTFKYEVIGKKTVEPDDLSVLRPVTASQLTLITCYPTYYIGSAPKRLVVFSKLIGEDEAQAQSSAGMHY
ncbi:MAG: class D sortase [Acidobacteriia bacterium]|nr:class D sortase [Terriglobia bacterium]